MDVSELLARYAAGEREFRRINLSSADLSGADLENITFWDVELCEVNLSGACLKNATLILANLEKANLSGANLSNAVLQRANLSLANLARTNLSNTDLFTAILGGANLSEANLYSAKLVTANLSFTLLESSNLCKTDFRGANLYKANLSQANLQDAELSGANLFFADLSGANLTNADLSGANLTDTNLTAANLSGTNLEYTVLVYQQVSEEIQQTNQELMTRIEDLEERLKKQNLSQAAINISNQGTNAPHSWNGFYFRSKSEIKIAEALDRTGVLFYPNSKVRLNTSKGRENKETDFLIFYSGKWGILEVDGEPWHPPSRTVHDHERDRLFKVHGIRVVEHYDACRCWEQPDAVVQEFLQILSQT